MVAEALDQIKTERLALANERARQEAEQQAQASVRVEAPGVNGVPQTFQEALAGMVEGMATAPAFQRFAADLMGTLDGQLQQPRPETPPERSRATIEELDDGVEKAVAELKTRTQAVQTYIGKKDQNFLTKY